MATSRLTARSVRAHLTTSTGLARFGPLIVRIASLGGLGGATEIALSVGPGCPPELCYSAPGTRVTGGGGHNQLPRAAEIARFACNLDSQCDGFTMTQPSLLSFAGAAPAASSSIFFSTARCGGAASGDAVPHPVASTSDSFPFCGSADICSAPDPVGFLYCPCYAYRLLANATGAGAAGAATTCNGFTNSSCAGFVLDHSSGNAQLFECAGGGHPGAFGSEGIYLKAQLPSAGPPGPPAGAIDLQADFATATPGPGGTEFMGIGGVMHGFDHMPESTAHGWNDTYNTLALSRVQESRLRIARTFYGPDWAMPGKWGAALNFSTPKFEAFCRWVGEMKELNVTVALQAGWWSPANTCTVGSPSKPGTPGACVPVPAIDLPIYSRWMSESVHELVEVRGFDNIKILVVFTEPLDYDSGTLPENTTRRGYYASAVRALHEQLKADNRRHLVQLQGPNSALSPSDLLFAEQELGGVLDIHSGHTYGLKTYKNWATAYSGAIKAVKMSGKPFIVDEGGDQDEGFRNSSGYGTYLALMHAALINSGASGSTMWLYRDQYYVWPMENSDGSDSFHHGLHMWGMEPWLVYEASVREAWYAVSMIMRHFGPSNRGAVGTRATSGQVDGVVVAALGGGCSRAVLLVNEESRAAKVDVRLAGWKDGCPVVPVLKRYEYNPAQSPTDSVQISAGEETGPSGDGALLHDTVPPGGVVVWSNVGDP